MGRKAKYADVLNDDCTHLFAELVRLRDLAASTAAKYAVGSMEQKMSIWLWERAVRDVDQMRIALHKRDAMRAVKGEK